MPTAARECKEIFPFDSPIATLDEGHTHCLSRAMLRTPLFALAFALGVGTGHAASADAGLGEAPSLGAGARDLAATLSLQAVHDGPDEAPLTNRPSRNIDNGLDPRLMPLARGTYD